MSMNILWKTTRSVRKKHLCMCTCMHVSVGLFVEMCWCIQYVWVNVERALSPACTRLHDQAIQATLNEPCMHLHSSNSHSLRNPREWTTVVISVLIFTDKELALTTGWFSVPSKMKNPQFISIGSPLQAEDRCMCVDAVLDEVFTLSQDRLHWV